MSLDSSLKFKSMLTLLCQGFLWDVSKKTVNFKFIYNFGYHVRLTNCHWAKYAEISCSCLFWSLKLWSNQHNVAYKTAYVCRPLQTIENSKSLQPPFWIKWPQSWNWRKLRLKILIVCSYQSSLWTVDTYGSNRWKTSGHNSECLSLQTRLASLVE